MPEIRNYIVKAYHTDSSAREIVEIIAAYDAADAITQFKIRYRGSSRWSKEENKMVRLVGKPFYVGPVENARS